MKHWLSHPLMTILLLLVWLALQHSSSVGTIVMGLIIALGLSRLWDRFDPAPVRLRHPGKLLALGLRVLVDILVSNYAVARLIMTRRIPASGFVAIELQLTRPAGLAMLAAIITATPGTIWVSHDADGRRLLIHVLDSESSARLVHNIKQRYEPSLLEVFQ